MGCLIQPTARCGVSRAGAAPDSDGQLRSRLALRCSCGSGCCFRRPDVPSRARAAHTAQRALPRHWSAGAGPAGVPGISGPTGEGAKSRGWTGVFGAVQGAVDGGWSQAHLSFPSAPELRAGGLGSRLEVLKGGVCPGHG